VNLSAWALRHRSLTLYLIIAVAAAGIWAYLSLGRAEDPPFTIKQMVVQVNWPGASAEQMARSVVDRIERKLQELPSLDYVDSSVQPGHAVMIVSLRDDTPPADVTGLWYQVRKKVGDLAPTLPQGVQGPYFNDEFGDVFGLVYAFTGDGFSRNRGKTPGAGRGQAGWPRHRMTSARRGTGGASGTPRRAPR
jgi:multidrug efflux pump subunit AcrB